MSVGDSVELGDELHVRAALEMMMAFRSLPLDVGMCKLLSFIGLKGTIQPLVVGGEKRMWATPHTVVSAVRRLCSGQSGKIYREN